MDPPCAPRPGISHVVFDFDGTLSWLRHGWPTIMLDLFRDNFPTRPGETAEQVDHVLEEGILSLNGKPTIFQMRRFVEMVAERDGPALDAEALRQEYQRRLDEAIARRSARIYTAEADRDDYVVHGARRLIEHLSRLSLTLVVLSSTDEYRVREEAALLELAPYFEPRIHGGTSDPSTFSKRAVFDRLLAEANATGDVLLSFGDGPVELADTKALGGIAVAVCSDEHDNGSGRCDVSKRRELIAAGADAVIPDFRDAPALVDDFWDAPNENMVEPLDLSRLRVHPIASRRSLTCVHDILVDPDSPPPACPPHITERVQMAAGHVRQVRNAAAAVMLIYGAHLLRNGTASILERMMAEGWLTHLATNGAGTIHDWEYAWFGESTESVEMNVADGTFGTWHETARNIHVAIMAAALEESATAGRLGRSSAKTASTIPSSLTNSPTRFAPNRRTNSRPLAPICSARSNATACRPADSVEHRRKHASIVAQAFRHGVPLTVHPGIGYDIISNHPIFSGSGDRPGGAGLQAVRRSRRTARRRRGAVGRLGDHGAAGLREEPQLREQPATAGRPPDCARSHDLRRRPAGRRRLGLDTGRTAQDEPGLLPALLQELFPHGRRHALPAMRQSRSCTSSITCSSNHERPAIRRTRPRYAELHIGVLGDFCLDRYYEIDPARDETSIETGCTVHNVVRVRSQPGGAGTVLNNLAAPRRRPHHADRHLRRRRRRL